MEIKRIQSVNFLGKVKGKARDMKTKWDSKVERNTDKIKKAKNWLLDDMDKGEIQDFLDKSFSEKIKLGKFKKVKNDNGGMYKFLAGLPETKSYECGYIFRNGNDIRMYPDGETFTANNSNDPNQLKKIQIQALNWFDSKDDEAVKKFY